MTPAHQHTDLTTTTYPVRPTNCFVSVPSRSSGLAGVTCRAASAPPGTSQAAAPDLDALTNCADNQRACLANKCSQTQGGWQVWRGRVVRFSAHAWRACLPKGNAGSNPALSAPRHTLRAARVCLQMCPFCRKGTFTFNCAVFPSCVNLSLLSVIVNYSAQ